MKQTLVGILATIVIALGASWMSLNKRIDILEVQVQNDHDMFIVNQEKASKDMCVLMQKINDIQIKVTQLGDLKADKEFK